MALLILHSVLFCKGAGLLQIRYLIPVHAGILLHRVHHGDALEGLSEIHLHAVVHDLRGSQDLLGHRAVEVLRQIHHAVVIRIRLVELHQGKLRIVAGIQSLVAEHAADLIDALQAAHDQALQVQLQGNAQLEILIQRVEMRLEGTGSRAARVRHQHRRLHLQEALAVQVAADAAQNPGALDKGVLYLGVHDQIRVALTVTDVRVRQAVELLRKNLKALGKERDLCGVDRDLAGLRAEHLAAHADDISDVIFLEILIGLLAQDVPGHVALDISLEILHVAEGSLSHDALGHHTARDCHGLSLQLLKAVLDLLAVMRHVIFRQAEGILPLRLQLRQLVPADLQKLSQILLLPVLYLLFFHSHVLLPLLFLLTSISESRALCIRSFPPGSPPGSCRPPGRRSGPFLPETRWKSFRSGCSPRRIPPA